MYAYDLCTPDIANIIIPFHTLTGCDSNNGFYGHGKKSLYDKVAKIPRFREMIIDVGKELPLPHSVRKSMKEFVIQVIYGDCKNKTPGQARAAKWKSIKKKSTLRLCPDTDSLNHVCDQANYLAYVELHPEIQDHPSPIGNGWMLVDGRCRPIHHSLSALPTNIFRTSSVDTDETDPSDCESSDSNVDIFSSDNDG